MKDQELYGQILGIENPWHVERVELDKGGLEVRVHVGNGQQRLPCPTCGVACSRYDTRPRRWRHLDTCQYRTILVAVVPRIECEEHGVLQVDVPWSEPGSRFTALFEALVISWLQEASVSAVSRQLKLSWGATYGILARAVGRGLERRQRRLPRRLGVDETSFQKRHEYVTVVLDQEEGTVVHVADGRGRDTLDGFLESFSEKELGQVESVAMDMWPAYIGSVMAKIPSAADKIAFDKFHVAQYLSQAVDKVRREENRSLVAAGDEQLKGTKFLWLQNPETLSEERWEGFKALRASSLKTARAWAIKELAMTLWQYRSRGWATKAWEKWYRWAIRSQLEPIRKVAKTIKRHLWGIVNAIVMGITNARSEGMNSRIQWVKYMARGYRNRDRFRTAIYFHLGGLDLYPAGVQK
jgi:transposase